MRRPETKEEIFRIIAPLLEKLPTTPIPKQLIVAIREDSTAKKASLPVTIAWRLYQEGLKLEERFETVFQLPKGSLRDENPLTNFHILYSMAPGFINEVEEHIRGESIAEETAQEAVKLRYINPQQPNTSLYVAEIHIALNTLAQFMKTDPTGFTLVDRVAYGTPLPNSPLTLIHRYPPMVKIIQIGAERYKSLYRAVAEQTPSSNP